MTQPTTIFGPYGTRLEEEAQKKNFLLDGPGDVIASGTVRQTLGTISHEYLRTGARGVTVPCFGSRTLLHEAGGERAYRSVLKESLGLVLDNLEGLSSRVRQDLTLLFCLGPMNDCYALELAPNVKEATEFHSRQISAVEEVSRSVHIPLTIIFETIPAGSEAVGIARALRQRNRRNLSGIVSYPFTIDGTPLGRETFPSIFRRVKEEGGTRALKGQSLNCGPIEGAAKALETLNAHGHDVLGVYPNASSRPHHELDQVDGTKGLIDRHATAAFLRYLGKKHALQFIGGCCGYGHEDVKAIAGSALISDRLPPTDVTARPLSLYL